ncbi:MCE family protein [Pseudonocardia halophobica]|uniref:Mammalian cell entry protein n=1 Tax=Pseudonocardia halophobica TaxID=29401 RepID=A0A9W6KY64_9PSEU|nr:MCE family protein [Pseudonocardia halophobica]GLL09848.1 mammalian cell entry protein [Pseudonocardia halophobica]
MSRILILRVLAAVVVAVLVAGVLVAVSVSGTRKASAYFTSTTGMYPGDEVRILGVPVGKIDAITPEGNQVKVDFHYDSDQEVPADAQAAIVAPSLVTTRYLQLAPRYTGGPTLAEGAIIPLERTAVPVEWDSIKDQLSRLSTDLGPVADDPDGSLARALSVGADTLQGQGAGLNDTLKRLAAATTTLADGSDDLFGTVNNLQVFTAALATSDKQIEEFGTRLASVSGILDENRDQLGAALADLRTTVGTVQQFVADNRDRLGTSVDRLAGVTGILAAQQEDLAGVLHAAPLPLTNLYNAIQPGTASLHGQLALANLQNPSLFVCSGIAAAGNLDPQEAAKQCAAALGPLLDLLKVNYPPVAANPLSRPGSLPTEASPRAPLPADGPSAILPPVTGQGGLSELLTPQGGTR